MSYFITVIISCFLGVLGGMWISVIDINAGSGFVEDAIKQKCFTAEQFSNGGVCIPEQPFVAVVRNSDGNTDLIWGEESISKLLSSPTPAQEEKP